jgi:hypothetical protein
MVGIGAETELNCFCQIRGLAPIPAHILPQLALIKDILCAGRDGGGMYHV